MKLSLFLLSFVALIQSLTIASDSIYCNTTAHCPESMPCCSFTGVCGTGEYCLGSCNPAYSYSIDACLPVPVCKDMSTLFNKYSDKLVNAYSYLGNASEADWTYTGYVMDYEDEESLVLAMPKNTTGTVLSTTRYMWYGKYSIRLKTSHLAGVITAIVLYSQVEDEIDYEFVGTDLDTAQTNFYWQGTLNYSNSANISTTDTFSNFHTYEIDWQEDKTVWSIDGVVGRTLYKNETYNATTGVYRYPQTPSRIQISIWPGGDSSQGQGTIEWAGGAIDWDAEDISDPGYYYMILNEANITCYDPPKGTTKNGTSSYKFVSSDSFLEKDVAIVDANMILKNLGDSGLTNYTSSSSSSSSSAKTSKTTSSKSSNNKSDSSFSTAESQITSSSSINAEQKTKFFQDLSTTANSTGGAVSVLTNNWVSMVIGFIVTYIL
ncbi:hypothetical protein TPHA_0F03340 [Tetrapisispora phaffii CBS 4417]|uniref:Crh-like protein n=1 Tax=Tetrapisispora phaffii (strain ATCC 24235 / CBS 4417 / NBRC 1672 / NRRL Y-8282 / UCD 70-5) TaxID=1071381 RepID=G8BUM9_TETPH|nr:hypothetical protein TPHA_0F03340 [Tetrapisispora phaffii CBS 4417]CCE63815.1 hypothetical protein TPHA_0F03340 [Tetrapisispora phaffii CBS 4417]